MARRDSIDRGATVSAALHQCMRGMQRSLERNLDALSRSVTPASVHRCRTQIRRLRALLQAFKHEFGPAALARYEIALRRLTRDLAPLREADVEQQIILRLSEDRRTPKDDGLQELLALAAQARSHAVLDLKAKMLDKAWVRCRERLRRAASDPKLIAQSRLPMASARIRVLRRCRRRLRQRLRARKDSPKALHKLRLKVKRLRYLLECCGPVEPALQAELKELRLLQDRLGEFHDEWSLRRGFPRRARGRRVNVDICAALHCRREELVHGIEKHRNRLLRIWKDGRCGRIRSPRTAAPA